MNNERGAENRRLLFRLRSVSYGWRRIRREKICDELLVPSKLEG